MTPETGVTPEGEKKRWYARYGECACCGAEGPLTGRGLAERCHRRYRDTDRLGEWPTTRELVEADIRMVLETGAPYRVVAARCGVSEQRVVRTVARWRLGVVAGGGPVPGVVLGPHQSGVAA